MSQPETPASIIAFVFAILGITSFLPCIGPIVAIVAGSGERSALGRAAVVIGWVTLVMYAAVVVVIAVLALVLGLVVAFSP